MPFKFKHYVIYVIKGIYGGGGGVFSWMEIVFDIH